MTPAELKRDVQLLDPFIRRKKIKINKSHVFWVVWHAGAMLKLEPVKEPFLQFQIM